MAFYVLDDHNNRVLAFDQEGILAVLQQAIADQSLENINPDSAVASRLRSIINGTAHHIEFVTQAQYNDLEQAGQLIEGCYYFITDDETAENFEDAIEALQTAVEALTASLTAQAETSRSFPTWSQLRSYVFALGDMPTRVEITTTVGTALVIYPCLYRADYDPNADGFKITSISYIDANGNVHAIGSQADYSQTTVWKKGGWNE